jgi:molybdopterin converting factor small subunit
MVEIRYKDQFEVCELAGQTVSEARGQFKGEFGIPGKAQAKLNGSKIKTSAELNTVLNDDDKLTFAVSHGKGAYLVGAMLLALVITGGIFAAGFINATTTLNASAPTSNFADVTANMTVPAWSAWGFFKGTINGGDIFAVDTATSSYDGDLVVTVSLGNADQLVKVYRALSLQIAMLDSANATLDINESNITTAGDANDWVMLTLDNGSVSMFPEGVAGGDNMRVVVKKGFFITHVFSGATGASPELFCEVAQR